MQEHREVKKGRRSHRSKTISRQGILGQKGINLIERIVLDMHSRWTSSGPNEVGIDGYIEFFDPGTGRAFGTTVAVQSKAVSSFQNEDADSFDYWCKTNDLEYWLNGNMPVLLIVSKPAENEAYWVDVKSYFKDRTDVSQTRVHFIKSSTRFTPESFHEIVRLAEPIDKGLFFPPLPRPENLYSNLLTLESFPDNIFIAPTELRRPADVWYAIRGKERGVGGAWIIKNKQILSFRNLKDRAWAGVCDQGEVEPLDSSEWAETEDEDRLRDFVQLCNQTLRYCQGRQFRYWPNQECYAFVGTLESGTTRVPYRSLKQESKIAAVKRYEGKGKNKDYEWLRHIAFKGQFRRLAGTWYLEITPTYRFTTDGERLERFHEERLKTIKRIEGNRAVLSAVLFWASQLSASVELFDKTERLLKFGDLLKFDSPVGLDDEDWGKRDPDSIKKPKDDDAILYLPFDGSRG